MAMDTIKIDNKNVRMVAHRGLSGLEKENTCSAFVAACNRATYFGVETDVHRTADGQFVIFHDDNTARVGIDHMVIEETTFDTLRKLQLTDIDGKSRVSGACHLYFLCAEKPDPSPPPLSAAARTVPHQRLGRPRAGGSGKV